MKQENIENLKRFKNGSLLLGEVKPLSNPENNFCVTEFEKFTANPSSSHFASFTKVELCRLLDNFYEHDMFAADLNKYSYLSRLIENAHCIEVNFSKYKESKPESLSPEGFVDYLIENCEKNEKTIDNEGRYYTNHYTVRMKNDLTNPIPAHLTFDITKQGLQTSNKDNFYALYASSILDTLKAGDNFEFLLHANKNHLTLGLREMFIADKVFSKERKNFEVPPPPYVENPNFMAAQKSAETQK